MAKSRWNTVIKDGNGKFVRICNTCKFPITKINSCTESLHQNHITNMRKGAKNYYQRHKPDVLKANKKRYDARTPAQIEHKRIIHYEYQLKMKYGLSKEDIDKMLIEQNFACKICAEKFNQTPFVDHDHKTGKVRGLLCRICNLGLGWVEKMTVEKCIIYLK